MRRPHILAYSQMSKGPAPTIQSAPRAFNRCNALINAWLSITVNSRSSVSTASRASAPAYCVRIMRTASTVSTTPRAFILLADASDNQQRVVRQDSLLQVCYLRSRRLHSDVAFLRSREDHRHRLIVEGLHEVIGVRREEAKRSLVASPSLILRTDVQPAAQIPAKPASGRVSSRANQMSPPASLLNALNDVKGTRQRSAHAILRSPDDIKFRSSMTLFGLRS